MLLNDNNIIGQPWVALLPIALTLLAFALTYLVLRPIASFIQAKANGNRFAAIAVRVTHFAEVIVQDLEATMKASLVEKSADGSLSKEDVLKLRDEALARLKALLAANGLKELTGALGVISGAPLDAYLTGVVETAVAKMPTKPLVVAASPNA